MGRTIISPKVKSDLIWYHKRCPEVSYYRLGVAFGINRSTVRSIILKDAERAPNQQQGGFLSRVRDWVRRVFNG